MQNKTFFCSILSLTTLIATLFVSYLLKVPSHFSYKYKKDFMRLNLILWVPIVPINHMLFAMKIIKYFAYEDLIKVQ